MWHFVRKAIITGGLLCFLAVGGMRPAAAQHNGDELAFQGFSNPVGLSVRAFGMGGASVAQEGEAALLGANPASLLNMEDVQVSLSGGYARRMWREEQVWYPERTFKLYPFMMEGLWMPKREHSGVPSDSLIMHLIDPTDISTPVQGQEPFSRERADWKRKTDGVTLGGLSVGVPLDVMSYPVVLAASIQRHFDVHNFDRNDTYLNPHPGIRSEETISPPDTAQIHWWRYQRDRTGGIYSASFAAAVKAMKHIEVGANVSVLRGETEDQLQLRKVGRFDLVPTENTFTFFYQDGEERTTGTSTLRGVKLQTGLIVDYEQFNLGLAYRLPYTQKREWSYVRRSSAQSGEEEVSGVDRARMPERYSLGITFRPLQTVQVAADLVHTPFSEAKFDVEGLPAAQDTSYRSAFHWVDQTLLRFGVEYRPSAVVSLRAGYRNVPQPFIPAGAAIRNRGPNRNIYTVGISIRLWKGRLDSALEHRRLKYWDQYESNTNYSLETSNRFRLGYLISF